MTPRCPTDCDLGRSDGGSAFGRISDESTQERPLREHEDQRDRRGRDERRERERGPRRPEQVREPDLDRLLPLVGKEHVREEEVVPVGDEAEEEDERDTRLRERDPDVAEGRPLAAAVDTGRIEQCRGSAVE